MATVAWVGLVGLMCVQSLGVLLALGLVVRGKGRMTQLTHGEQCLSFILQCVWLAVMVAAVVWLKA